MRMLEVFNKKVGNGYVVGLGGCELIRIWFTKDGESQSIFSQEEAKELADGMCSWINEKYDIESLDEKEFGGSSELSQFFLDMIEHLASEIKE